MPTIKKYDPNIYMSVHTVEVEFLTFTNGRKVVVDINGNCKGESILSSGIDSACEKLLNELDKDNEIRFAGLILDRNNINDDEDLKKMIVGARIIKVVKQK